ncbi:MAG: ABC transporter substrate-binding protein [Alphaproteobacteria bacterium]|nr:MAG: ABC transporter substrate-binding protein [Alphaproteobacteria bacterium]
MLICCINEQFCKHGVSTHGPLKYGKSFTHFDYVNPHAPKGGDLRMGIQGTFNSLNPFILKGTPAAGMTPLHTSFVFASLTTKSDDEAASEYCLIAQNITRSADNTWVDFHLRKEATFSDGTPILADDVVFSFTTFMTKGSPIFRQYYKGISHAEAIGKRHVRFHIDDKKNAELPVIIGHMPIISKNFYTSHDFATDTTTLPIGSGPYRVASVTMGKEIIYERIPNWWGADLPVARGRFNVDKVHMIYMMDDSVLFEAFKAGNLNFRMETSTQRWEKGYRFAAITRGDAVKQLITIAPFAGCSVLYMNTRRTPLDDIHLRRALQASFDFPTINRNYFAGHNRDARSYFAGSKFEGNGPLSPKERHIIKELKLTGLPDGYEGSFYPMGTHTDQRARLLTAQKILTKAGYTLRSGKLFAPGSSAPVTLTVTYIAGQGSIEKILQSIQRNALRLGITLQLHPCETPQAVRKQNTFDFDLIVGTSVQSLSPANEQRDFWGCSAAKTEGSGNVSGICQPSIDILIDHIIDATDHERLVPRIQLLDRLLLHWYIGVPLWHVPNIKLATHKTIKIPRTIGKASHFDIMSVWIEGNEKAC